MVLPGQRQSVSESVEVSPDTYLVQSYLSKHRTGARRRQNERVHAVRSAAVWPDHGRVAVVLGVITIAVVATLTLLSGTISTVLQNIMNAM